MIYVSWWDSDGNEIEDMPGLDLEVLPRVGERIHFWHDSFSTHTHERRDFEVLGVEHDLRWMVEGPRPKLVQTAGLTVRVLTPPAP